jgi:phospholipase/carboxylesterase
MHTDDLTQRAAVPRPSLSRREFVLTGASALGVSLLTGCKTSTAPVASPRLSARPGIPTATPQLGLSALGLGGDRDGLLYVPQSYSPDALMPLFVALHGAGGSASFWNTYQARAEARGMVLLVPESRSYTWDLLVTGLGPDVAFLDRALRYTFERCRVAPERIAFGGFSDGASYALSLGLSNGDLFSHLVAYSPGFIQATNPIVWQPRIFVSHGTADTVLPVTRSRDVIVPSLRNAGYDVTYQEFNGGHEVPAAISEAALEWFLAP